MKKYIILSSLLLILSVLTANAQQTASIKGLIIDKGTRDAIPYANLLVTGTSIGIQADSTGTFSIPNLKPGVYTLQISSVGYKTMITPEYILKASDLFINIELEENANNLQEVSVYGSTFRRSTDSPVSLHVIGIQEIEKSPGANRDISRIVQSYPGVGYSPVGYRNDLIVRGGGPSENRFFLDGVEIPNINHFSTQGASGGPVGIINADLIREVNFYTGAFPASSGNALSSVLDFKLREGAPNKNTLKATLGASEFSLASNGHLSKKTTYLVSVRQSYLQFLFDLLGLPFLPTYTDTQFKIKTKINSTNEITFMGLAGIDKMRLNKKATSEDAEYILGYLPNVNQETFTVGSVYKHYSKKHIQTIVLSHSYLNNKYIKYDENDASNPDKLRLNYKSKEQETKFRAENLSRMGSWKLNTGINLDYIQYTNNTFQRFFRNNVAGTYLYATDLSFLRWGAFGTLNYISDNERFSGSIGVRADAAGYSSKMNNLLDQLSPRLSLSYLLIENLSLSSSAGRYYQLPPFTAMGYKDNNGKYVNKGLNYMTVDQIASGLSYQIKDNIQVSAEGFYKKYRNTPLSVDDNIPLMNKGDNYGFIGNERLVSTAQGRAYGVEFLGRWLVPRKVNASAALTLFNSEYRSNEQSSYIPSAWDNGYIFNLTGTYYLPKNWSLGIKLRSIGGAPYTPYDNDKSSLVQAWDAQGEPYFDYSKYNTLNNPSYTQLDVRVDKTYYIKKMMLGFYIDIQNITGSILKSQDVIVSTGKIENPDAPKEQQRYEMKSIKQTSGTTVPTIGITLEI